jgi:hypothetical protein
LPRALPILLVGAVGAVLFVIAAVGAVDATSDEMPRHLLTALVATLAWVFSQSWVALYAGGGSREAWIWPLLSTLLVVATFASGAPVFTRSLPARLHLWLAVAAAAAQAAALAREAIVLRRRRAALVGLDERRGPA